MVIGEKYIFFFHHDARLSRQLIKQLSAQNVKVHYSSSTENISELLSEKVPDIILSCVASAQINCIEILKITRQYPLEERPMILMIGQANTKLRNLLLNAGVYDYIEEPVGFLKLKAAVMNIYHKLETTEKEKLLNEKYLNASSLQALDEADSLFAPLKKSAKPLTVDKNKENTKNKASDNIVPWAQNETDPSFSKQNSSSEQGIENNKKVKNKDEELSPWEFNNVESKALQDEENNIENSKTQVTSVEFENEIENEDLEFNEINDHEEISPEAKRIKNETEDLQGDSYWKLKSQGQGEEKILKMHHDELLSKRNDDMHPSGTDSEIKPKTPQKDFSLEPLSDTDKQVDRETYTQISSKEESHKNSTTFNEQELTRQLLSYIQTQKQIQEPTPSDKVIQQRLIKQKYLWLCRGALKSFQGQLKNNPMPSRKRLQDKINKLKS